MAIETHGNMIGSHSGPRPDSSTRGLQHSGAGDLSLSHLLRQLWQGKVTIIAVALVFALASVTYSLWQPNIYHASALLAPAEPDEAGVQGLLGEFSGLASLAGLPSRAPRVDKAIIAIETLRSRAFLARFIRDHDLLVPLFAARGWDRKSGKLLLDEDIYDGKSQRWVRRISGGRPAKPTDEEAYNKFREWMSVTQDKKTGLVTIAVDALSPNLAKEWVDALIQDVNEAMRTSDLEEADRSITYLQKQLTQTQVADIQKVFYNLIEQQTKTRMLAQVRREYAFKVIDPPTIPERKARPARALICIFGTLFGGMMGMVWVLLRPARARIES